MNNRVKELLDKLVEEHIEVLHDFTLEKMINEIIEDNSNVIRWGGTPQGLYPEELEALNLVKSNEKIIKLFSKIISFDINDRELIESYKTQIVDSYIQIKDKVHKENKGYKNQIIFLEHDYEPTACFCGFGEGKYPVLEEPKYIKYNYQEELYNGMGKLDYVIWNELGELRDAFDELGIEDFLFDSKSYESIRELYKYKTYQLIHHAFGELGIKLFDGIPIKLPLYIYGNEHDCEVLNIYVFE